MFVKQGFMLINTDNVVAISIYKLNGCEPELERFYLKFWLNFFVDDEDKKTPDQQYESLIAEDLEQAKLFHSVIAEAIATGVKLLDLDLIEKKEN